MPHGPVLKRDCSWQGCVTYTKELCDPVWQGPADREWSRGEFNGPIALVAIGIPCSTTTVAKGIAGVVVVVAVALLASRTTEHLKHTTAETRVHFPIASAAPSRDDGVTPVVGAPPREASTTTHARALHRVARRTVDDFVIPLQFVKCKGSRG